MEKGIDQLLTELDQMQRALNTSPAPTPALTQPWSKEIVLFLSCSILIFGLVVLFLMASLVRKGSDADQVLRVCSLPLIIVAAIFLVVTGYTSEQIAPVMGLLGAIAGYLLGAKRSSRPRE